MTPIEFLSHLRSLDIRIWVEGDRLLCNAPKGALTPQLRAELESHKPELIAYLQSVRIASISQAHPLVRIERKDHHSLSFAQQRLWFLDQLEPGSASYNISDATRLVGPLNRGALEQSLQEIIRRHEILRTTFVKLEGQPVQIIAPTLDFKLPIVDLGALSGEQREARVQEIAAEGALRPFDLSTGPLLRTTLIKLDDHNHVLLSTIHHIISDGWSLGILMRELAALYKAFSSGEPSPLPDLSIQYVDFAQWQREWLRGEVLESQLSYWRRQLAGAPAVLELPTDRPRPAVQTFAGHVLAFTFPRALLESPALTQPAGRRDAVHDAAGGVQGAPVPLQRAA